VKREAEEDWGEVNSDTLLLAVAIICLVVGVGGLLWLLM
jgi:hypothetical protein